MFLCRFSESNSNLNYKCVIVCSEIFPKNILRYTSSDYFIEPSIDLKNLPPFDEILQQKDLSSKKHYWSETKRPRYDLFRGIVCDNVPIFDT